MRIQLHAEYESVSEDAEPQNKNFDNDPKLKNFLGHEKLFSLFKTSINLSRASRLQRERLDPTNRRKK
jgi:hypothetical protein